MTWQPDAYVSFKDRGQFGKHLIHKCSGELLKTLTVPRLQIQGTGLVTTHNPGCARSGSFKRNRKPCHAGEVAARGYGYNYRHLRHFIEGFRRYHQHGSGSVSYTHLTLPTTERV